MNANALVVLGLMMKFSAKIYEDEKLDLGYFEHEFLIRNNVDFTIDCNLLSSIAYIPNVAL